MALCKLFHVFSLLIELFLNDFKMFFFCFSELVFFANFLDDIIDLDVAVVVVVSIVANKCCECGSAKSASFTSKCSSLAFDLAE